MRGDPPSPRVRLEVAFLDADQVAPAPVPPATADEHARLTVLVVASEADLRRYVRECLRVRTDLRLVEAATATEALTLAGAYSPELLVVDESESDVLLTLSHLRAIVIVDDMPRRSPVSAPHVRRLARPFTGEGLMQEVTQLLGWP
jgi:hypothetical protein